MEDRLELELEVASQDEEAPVKRPPIQTLVFFDLEASELSGSTLKSRITELAMVAVSTTELVIFSPHLVIKVLFA
jgi:hypothetical protein